MEDSSRTNVPPILQRPRVLALIGALVVLVIVLITACGGGDNAADAGADTTNVDIIDPDADLGTETDTSPDATTAEPPSTPPQVPAADLPITKVKGKPLKRGMNNKRVVALQEGLIYLGYLEEGSADGQFGRETKKAVQEFQLEMGLNGDGVAGQKTIRSINKAVKKAPAGGQLPPADDSATTDEAPIDAGTDGTGDGTEGSGTDGGTGEDTGAGSG